MKIKQLAVIAVVYMAFMFPISLVMLHTDKTWLYSLAFAVLSGILFTVLMILFRRFYRPEKVDEKKVG